MQEQINNLIEENKKLMRDLQDLTDEVYRNN